MTEPGESAEPAWPALLLVAVLLGSLVAPVLALAAAVPNCLLDCSTLGPGPQARDEHQVLAALLIGTVLPIAGMVLAVRLDRLRWRRGFGIVMVVSLMTTFLAWLAIGGTLRRETPARPDSPRYCQEYSGGDTTCPGG